MLRRARDVMRRFPSVHRAIRSVWTPPERIYRHLYFDGLLKVEIEPGLALNLECHGEQLENELFWRGFGSWEGKSLKIWIVLARTANFVADIGANTGVYALVAQAVRPTAKIIAVEPSKRVFAKLQRNIALNEFPITAVECAASDASGTATFFDFPLEHQYSGSLEAGMGGSVEIEVQSERMDTILELYGFDRLDLVKIDVELHEPAVLRGMRQTLERCRPTMLVEVLTDEIERGVREAIAGLDYRIVPIGGDHSPDPKGDARNFLIAQDHVLKALSSIPDTWLPQLQP